MDIDELVDSIDILDYISQYTDFTEQNGEYWALSPLKEEKTPSFSVRRETQKFYDFSSGKGGSVVYFVQCYNHCSLDEAVEILKAYSGCSGTVTPKRRLQCTEIAKRFSIRRRDSSASQAKPLSKDYMERYERRPDKLKVWENEGISRDTLERFQVRYDSFSNCLVYPIRNISGDIINIGGRTLDPDWKAKRIRKYTYFKPWGELNTIYGVAENMSSILSEREIILFEGAKSVMIADTWGIRNTGAILTSHLNKNQKKILTELGCRVVFALDKDINIREDKHISRLKQFVNVEYVYDRDNLLEAKDSPVDKGLETWKKLYEGRLSWH